MDFKELKQKTGQELNALLFETRQKLAELRKKALTGELKKVSDISVARKAIARIKTLLKSEKK